MNPAAQARQVIQGRWLGATVHSRGKGWIKHQHPTNPNKFSFSTQVGPGHWHKGDGPYTEADEIDTAWVTSSGFWDYECTQADHHAYVRDSVPVSYRYVDAATSGEIELRIDAPEWVNESGDTESLGISFSQVTPSINDDIIRWDGVADGWDIEVYNQTARLAKRIYINSLAQLGSTPTLTGNVHLSIPFQFVKSSGLQFYVDGSLWDEKNNNPVLTASDVEVRLDGIPIFYLLKPWFEDAESDQTFGEILCRKVGANFFADVRIPYSSLTTAVFPIMIDPTVGPLQIGASGDDTYEVLLTGVTDHDQAHARILYQSSSYLNAAGSKWTISGIAGGETIDNTSYVECYVYSTANDDFSLNLRGENAANPADYDSSTSDLTDRTYHGTVSPTWTELATGVGWISSSGDIDISSALQAVFDGANWDDGDDLALYWYPSGEQDPGKGYWRSYDGSSSLAPKITIDYTAGGSAFFSTALGGDRIRSSRLHSTRLG